MHNADQPTRASGAALVSAVVLLAVLTRLPQLLGGHLLVDGDEAVLGLMAKHLSEGRAVPPFLYGQGYGLAWIEAAAGAAAFLLAGVSGTALKAAMLALWTAGVVFTALAARRWAGPLAGLAAALGLVFCPGWAAWSLKARGGYVTAFAASGLALWLLAGAGSAEARARRRSLAAGLAAGLSAAAQPIAGLALFPFLAAGLLDRERRRHAAAALLAAAAVLAGFAGLALVAGGRAWLPPLFDHPDPLRALFALPGRVWVGLSGAHYFNQAPEAGPWTRAATALWVAALAGLAGRALLALRRVAFGDPVLCCAAGVLATCAFSLAVAPQRFAHQYLFPLPGLVALGAALAWAPACRAGRARPLGLAALAAIVALGSGALFEFRRLCLCGLRPAAEASEPELVGALLARLREAGVAHAYCDDPMLQWTLAFESREAVLARWRRSTNERLPEYAAAVDAALRAGRPVALVLVRPNPGAPAPELPAGAEAAAALRVGDSFLVLPRATLADVRAAGFRLGPAERRDEPRVDPE